MAPLMWSCKTLLRGEKLPQMYSWISDSTITPSTVTEWKITFVCHCGIPIILGERSKRTPVIIDISLRWLVNEHQQTVGVSNTLELTCHTELINLCLSFWSLCTTKHVCRWWKIHHSIKTQIKRHLKSEMHHIWTDVFKNIKAIMWRFCEPSLLMYVQRPNETQLKLEWTITSLESYDH